mmetsp:Transcript_71606/g.173422  ORF Transcript_71606/g.173422 Transcript_71606/m.173422 type:complete len:452 (+) Transcript_71606:82-1437(+)
MSSQSELCHIFRLCWPTCLSSMLQFGLCVTPLVFAGHMGRLPLAAASLGGSWFNIIYYGTVGAATSIDTVVSQSFGQGDIDKCRAWMRRSVLLFSTMSLFVCIALSAARDVFRLFNLEPSIAEPAADYVEALIPGTPGFILFVCLQKYQQAMNIMTPPVICCFVSNLVTIWLCSMADDLTELGFALSVSRTFLFGLMVAIVGCTPLPEAPHTRHRVLDYAELLHLFRLAIAGAAMSGLEAGAFELYTFIAATLGPTKLDAHNIMLQISGMSFLTLPLGISVAASIRVGNLLGEGRPQAARHSARLCILIGATGMLCVGLIIWLLRWRLGPLFSDDPHVVACVASLAPIGAFFAVLDGFQGVSSGVLRAMGKQAFNAMSIFVSFYVVAMPISLTLCFHLGMSVAGLWWGMAIGLTGMSIGFGANIFFMVDWVLEADKAGGKLPSSSVEPLLA